MHRLPIFQDSRSFDERTERMIRDVRRQIDEDLQSFGFRRKKLLKPSLIKWDDDDDDDDDPASRLLSHDFFKLRPSSSSLKSPGSPGRVSSPPPRKEDYAGRTESVVDDYEPARSSAYGVGRSQLADDGRPFCMSFDVKDFEAEDISVSVEDDTLIVQAKRRTERDGAVSTKEFNRKIRLPRDVYPECLSSTLTSDGILTIEAQVPPPDYESAVSSPSTSVAEPGLNGNAPQKARDAVSNAAASAASSPTTSTSSSASPSSISRQSASIPLDTPVFATDPSTGRRKMELILAVGSPYKSDDISVKLQGRRLVIEAVHEEKWEGRTSKVSMQRDFDLSEDIDVTTVRALLKNSGQLTITAFAK